MVPMHIDALHNDISHALEEMFGRGVKDINEKLVGIAKKHNGKAYLVGGAVRDALMGIESKDYDYLITKIPIDTLAKELAAAIPSAKIDEVGKSFGIIKMSFGGEEYDIAIPRADVNREQVKTDPNIGVEADLLRRDFTMNAVAQDLETGSYISPPGYDGIGDINNKVIRAVGNPIDRFQEDPLRMLRAIQFSTRFGFTIEPETLDAIKRNKDLLKKVSGERFSDEFFKGWTKGKGDRTYFFRLLNDTGIGQMLFGNDFSPIPLKGDLPFLKNDKPHDTYLRQYVLAFLQSGNYEIMDKRAENHKYVQVARLLYDIHQKNRPLTDADIRLLSNSGSLLEFIIKTFYAVNENLGEWLQNYLSKPIIPKKESGKQHPYELPISGGELIELAHAAGIEIKGKAIGETINKLIQAYQKGDLVASDDVSKNKEQIAQWLNRINLKESFIRDAHQIDIMKSRISTILYK